MSPTQLVCPCANLNDAEGVSKNEALWCTWSVITRDNHSYTRTGTQTGNGETHSLPQRVVNCSELPLRGCHAAFVPSGLKHSCMCVSQIITMLITWWIKEIQTKEHGWRQETQSDTLSAGKSRRHVAYRVEATKWVRHRQPGGETGLRQRCIVTLKDVQTGGLAVVSISDNNSSNVIIGSLIKINLISATHHAFGLLKRSVPLRGCSRLTLTSFLGDPVTSVLPWAHLFTPGGTCPHVHRAVLL